MDPKYKELEQALITALDTFKDWVEFSDNKEDRHYYMGMGDATKGVLKYIRGERRTIYND